MKIRRYTYLIILFVATAFLAACTSDDVEREKAEGEMTHVSMTIGTRAATGVPETTTIPDELIHSWWVVFVNNAGNVQKIVSRDALLTSYVEEERVEFDIPVGTYTLYAFANISKSVLKTKTGLTFTEGAACPADIDSKTFALTNGYTGEIPMTGTQDVTVTGRANQTFSIEVVRMLAKMEFRYKNISSKDLTINSLSIKQVQKNPVPLLPDYDCLNDGWTFADLSTSASTYTRTYSPVISLDAKGGSTTSKTDIFYMMESQADFDTPSQSYLMTLNVTRSGVPDNLYFSLNKDEIQTIYRNDHVIVPLNIFDYIVGLDVSFYPPIGGYPQAEITEDKDKDEFYCTFKTQGTFEIIPTVYNASTGTGVYPPDWEYGTISVKSDPNHIFTTDPYLDSGELIGVLSDQQGTAIVDVTIKVRTSVSPLTYQEYPRRIYIIRSNT